MELKWTNKALSDLARLYEFLAPANQDAAARIVQSLATAPATLRTNPRIGEKLEEFEPREVRRSSGITRCVTKFRTPRFTCCGCGIRASIADQAHKVISAYVGILPNQAPAGCGSFRFCLDRQFQTRHGA